MGRCLPGKIFDPVPEKCLEKDIPVLEKSSQGYV